MQVPRHVLKLVRREIAALNKRIVNSIIRSNGTSNHIEKSREYTTRQTARKLVLDLEQFMEDYLATDAQRLKSRMRIAKAKRLEANAATDKKTVVETKVSNILSRLPRIPTAGEDTREFQLLPDLGPVRTFNDYTELKAKNDILADK